MIYLIHEYLTICAVFVVLLMCLYNASLIHFYFWVGKRKKKKEKEKVDSKFLQFDVLRLSCVQWI